MVVINEEKRDEVEEFEKKIFDGIRYLVKSNTKKTLVAIIGASLIGVTTLNENVHFGSTTLISPQENHYVWGIAPITSIKGDGKGNIMNIALLYSANEILDETKFNGNLGSYGLFFGYNQVFKNSDMSGNLYSLAIFSGFKLGENSSFNGNTNNKGIIIMEGNPENISVGSSQIIGLKNYKISKNKE